MELISSSLRKATYAPGMVDNLRPSYERPTEKFIQAASNPASLANSITSILPDMSFNALISSHTQQQSSAAAASRGAPVATRGTSSQRPPSFAAAAAAAARAQGGQSSNKDDWLDIDMTEEEQERMLQLDDGQGPQRLGSTGAGMSKDQKQWMMSTSNTGGSRGGGGGNSGTDGWDLSGGGKMGPSGEIDLTSLSESPPLNRRGRGPSGGNSRRQGVDLFAPNWGVNESKPGEKGKKKMWERMQGRNARDKMMDKDKSDLNPEEKVKRKRAKKTSKSMDKRGDGMKVVEEILLAESIPLSQASAFVSGDAKNKDGKAFCSQKALNMYRNGHQTDSDDSD